VNGVKDYEKTKKAIVDDILKNELFQNEQFLVVQLNNRSMRINGKRQSDQIHEQFRKRYIKTETDQIFFSLK
jgi:hypothetical protein